MDDKGPNESLSTTVAPPTTTIPSTCGECGHRISPTGQECVKDCEDCPCLKESPLCQLCQGDFASSDLDDDSRCADCAFDSKRIEEPLAKPMPQILAEKDAWEEENQQAYIAKRRIEEAPLAGYCKTCKVHVADFLDHVHQWGWDNRLRQNTGLYSCDFVFAPHVNMEALDQRTHLVTKEGLEEELPSILDREDGKTIFYAGKHNVINGLGGTCKTWISLAAALSAVGKGGRVAWWDFEDPAPDLARKGVAMGDWAYDIVSDQNRFRFFGPDLVGDDDALPALGQWLSWGRTHSLVVVDSAFSSGAPSDGGDVGPWLETFVEYWKSWDGIATLIVDHIPKREEGRPSGPIGSGEKFNAIRGANLATGGTPWGIDEPGKVTLKIEKDNPGQVGKKRTIATTVIGENDENGNFTMTFTVPDDADNEVDVRLPLLHALAAKGDEGAQGTKGVRDLVKGKNKAIDNAMKSLVTLKLVHREEASTPYVYTVTNEGQQMVENGVESFD